MSLLQMSITAGLLVLATVLIRAVALNRLPKAAFLVLWGVALLRLLIPAAIPARFGFYAAFSGVAGLILPDNGLRAFADSGLRWFIADEVPTYIVRYGVAVQAGIPPIAFIWLAGMAVFTIIFAAIYFMNHRRLRFAAPVCGNDFLDKWLAENRIFRKIAVMQSEKVTGPIVVGLIKPRIILPKYMDMSDERLLNHVLTHELFHIKRFDGLWKMLLVCAICVHWFNPLVWVMFVLASRDLELTCDEMVIRRFGIETKSAYAYAIIGMAEQRNRFALLDTGFGKNAITERIEAVMKTKKTSLLRMGAALITVAALVIGVLFVPAGYGSHWAARFSHEEVWVVSTPDAYFVVSIGMEDTSVAGHLPSVLEVTVRRADNRGNARSGLARYSMLNIDDNSRIFSMSVSFDSWDIYSPALLNTLPEIIFNTLYAATPCRPTVTFRHYF